MTSRGTIFPRGTIEFEHAETVPIAVPSRIPYSRHDISTVDVDAVTAVLRSDWLTQGPLVPRFETAVAAYCGAAYGVAVNSASSALHVACLAVGLGPEDWLWTSPNTYVASANCGLACGARIDFVDIDRSTLNMSVLALSAKLERAAQERRLPKVVIPVHFGGRSCDMAGIRTLAEQYGFRVVEDASHALGGRYHREPIGNCRYSDIAVFSFHPVKMITTGEGGLALTNDRALADRMALLRTNGITRDRANFEAEDEGPWYYEQLALGHNYRMTDIEAALGWSQLQRLDDFVRRRRALAARYDQLLTDLPLITPLAFPEGESSMHLYVVQLAEGVDRRGVFEHLRSAAIGVNVHYIPVHTQPYYRRMGFVRGDFPEAERHYDRALSLPMYPTLDEVDQDRIVTALSDALK